MSNLINAKPNATNTFGATGTDAVLVSSSGVGLTTKQLPKSVMDQLWLSTSIMTTLGDVTYGSTAGAATRLAGNITATKKFFSQTGTGTVSVAPTWATLVAADIPALAYSSLTGKPTLGTAAALDVGTGANNIPQLDGSQNLALPGVLQVAGNFDASGSVLVVNVNAGTVACAQGFSAGSGAFTVNSSGAAVAISYKGTAGATITSFATVAGSGAYADLSGTPTLGQQVTVDSGWTANADGGDKTAIIPSNATIAAMQAALNLVVAGFGDSFVAVADKVKALETALVANLLPNA